jgi:hypothetical protein
MPIGPSAKWTLLLAACGVMGFLGAKFGSSSRAPAAPDPAPAPIAVSDETRRAIRHVIEQDRQACRDCFAHRTKYVTSYLGGGVKVRGDAPVEAKLRDYIKRLREMDFNGCPDDFRMAYLLLIQAAVTKLVVIGRGDDTGALWGLLAAAGLAGGNPAVAVGGVNQMAQTTQKAKSKRETVDDRVIESWHKVEQVAARYGVWVAGRI